MDYMTRDDFYKQYGDTKVKFSSYYKYTFTFADGNGLTVNCGDDASDIYRFKVSADQEYTVSNLEPEDAYLNGEPIFFDH